MTISPERERQLLASVEYPPAALRAIQFLLGRVRELEKQEAALTESLVEVLAGFRCLSAQHGDIPTYDAEIIHKAHKALEAAR